jgi:hypothetical protein
MKKAVLAIVLFTGLLAAQDSVWKFHGFAEAQYRPPQDFSSLGGWTTAKKENSPVGIFNFSQVVTPTKPKKINWWQSYTGTFVGKATKVGFMEGGAAIGAEAGIHARFAEYGVFAPKKAWELTAFAIHEHGTYEGSGWTRIHVQKAITKSLKLGYHHQKYLGNGINVEAKLGKSPFSFFGVIARDNGKTKTMTAFRFVF